MAVTATIVYNIESAIHFDTFAYVSRTNISKSNVLEIYKNCEIFCNTRSRLTFHSNDLYVVLILKPQAYNNTYILNSFSLFKITNLKSLNHIAA